MTDASTQSRLPFISVVVPVRNEARHIETTLRGLLAQDYPAGRFEVVVVDGESTDATRDIVRALTATHPGLKLYGNPKRLSSAARNVGVGASAGDVVAVVDGHCRVESRRYLRDVAELFERTGADCLGRPQPLEVDGATAFQRAVAVARASRLGHNVSSYIYSDDEKFVSPQSVAVIYRRDVFRRVGLFDEGFDACEDVEFNYRVEQAGLRCYLSPRLRVNYVPRQTVGGLFHQLARYGRGRVRLLSKHPYQFSVVYLIVAALLGLAGTVGLAVALGHGLGATAGLAAGYAGLVGLTAVRLSWRERDPRLLGLLPVVFAAIHAGVCYGIVSELVTTGLAAARSRRWSLAGAR